MKVAAAQVLHYFADEAGDPTLFSGRGQVLVGTEGCSSHFILGVLAVADPPALSAELESLRAALLADPYFKDVPSMQPARRKTALAFHAKDDVPEVRREVFRVLIRHELKFFAVVRDKRNESRFLQLIWPQVGRVHAVDETSSAPYGEYYTKKRPMV